ncbi:16S rRNA (guanine(966)-N(2))-methyltransferase RsmD [Marinococcus halophilus]|uniref:rRNA methyltransferase n=1 Tax=Marinococcus halophilus TaxID=1371 RepID=A0A510Y1V9_MARHA|nr:16S rRNA (guanine(966)-N(2))-methyltransferase RsmD [Marinococcus halophilus]OZT81349.1 16S rRNA (guanine(966)-N(2))-methyltransferase RsmD [Marinococcus halophilus]GEK57300.1 rRNA methyltransferase [Marinococcus halophilus]
MRVIAGDFKGRRLKAVPGTGTRPTSDKVKEALFHKLGPFFSDGETVLDLFAGTGNLGIEALSRGCSSAVFVDKAQTAVKTVRSNIDALNLGERAEVYRSEASKAIDRLESRGRSFDLVFFDPPYAEEKAEQLVGKLLNCSMLKENGMLIWEHAAAKAAAFDERLSVFAEKNYGDTTLTILQLTGGPENGE